MFIIIDIQIDKYDAIITDAQYVSTHETEDEALAKVRELQQQVLDARRSGERLKLQEFHIVEVPNE